jgi:hypothetical protein
MLQIAQYILDVIGMEVSGHNCLFLAQQSASAFYPLK